MASQYDDSRKRLGSHVWQLGSDQNVDDGERWASVILGGGLIVMGLRQRSLPGALMAVLGGAMAYRGVTGHCHMYDALGVSTRRQHKSTTALPAGSGYKIEKTIHVNRTADDLYRYWRQLENLPRIMSNLVSVMETGEQRSHWVAEGVLGTRVEWDAEIIEDRPSELISWRSLPGSDVDTAGSVRFTSESFDRGTTLRISIKYDPPAGKLGATIASLLGDGLEHKLAEDLRKFKQAMEAGEVATTAGQPAGR
jgi:uncharacterized membrane protein